MCVLTFSEEVLIMRVLTALGILVFILLLMLINCSGGCSPAEYSVALFPMILLAIFIWVRLSAKKSD